MSLETLGPDCDVADIAAAMERDGACIVRDVLSAETLSCPPSVAKDLDPDLADLVGYTMGNFALGFCTSPELGDAGPSSNAPESVLGRGPRAYVNS